MEKETEAIIAEVRALLANLRARGIPDDQIDNLIGEPEEGRIQMDKRGVISLPDYGDVQIYLNPMERTLYILLMRYPQGIPVDDLYLYYDELCGIYSKQTVFGDMDIVKDAVGALVEDYPLHECLKDKEEDHRQTGQEGGSIHNYQREWHL